MMEPEESTLKLGGDKAVILYNQYLDYYNSNFLSIKKTSNNSKQSLEVIAYPNPFNNSTVFEIKTRYTSCKTIGSIKNCRICVSNLSCKRNKRRVH